EKQNPLCSWLTNPRKRLERFLRLGKGQFHYGSQITVELLQSDLRTSAELLGKLVGQDSVPGHFEERLVRCRKNPCRFGADPLLEGLKCFPASVVVSEVGDVLPQDHFPRASQLWCFQMAVVGLKLRNDLR